MMLLPAHIYSRVPCQPRGLFGPCVLAAERVVSLSVYSTTAASSSPRLLGSGGQLLAGRCLPDLTTTTDRVKGVCCMRVLRVVLELLVCTHIVESLVAVCL